MPLVHVRDDMNLEPEEFLILSQRTIQGYNFPRDRICLQVYDGNFREDC